MSFHVSLECIMWAIIEAAALDFKGFQARGRINALGLGIWLRCRNLEFRA